MFEKVSVASAEEEPDTSPERLVTFLQEAMRNNDSPKKNAGLKTALKYSSEDNQFKKLPDKFMVVMNTGSYQLMLGKYSSYQITSTEDLGDSATVSVAYTAPYEEMLKLKVKPENIKKDGQDGTALMKWRLKKDAKGKWGLSTIFYAAP